MQSLISISAKKTLFESVDSAIKNGLKGEESSFSFNIERKYTDKLTVSFLHGFDKKGAEKSAHVISEIILRVSAFISTDAIAGIFFTNTNFYDAVNSFTSYKLPDEHVAVKEEKLKKAILHFKLLN